MLRNLYPLSMTKILLVEDSVSLQRSLGTGLVNSGFVVDQAFDGEEAQCFISARGHDLIVLDLMIPKIDGLTLLERLRREGDLTPVLILSAMDRAEDRIKGLDLGADDYLIKPFSFEELVSRIRAVTRRREANPDRRIGALLTAGDLALDTRTRSASWRGTPLPLTPHEQGLLELLLRRRGQVFSHDALIDRLYSSDHHVTHNAIEAHVSTLRRKLREAGVDDLVRTRRGFGYFIER